MQRDVVSFRRETTLAEVIAALCERHVSGAPVVDEDGALIGIITEYALLDVLFDPSMKTAPVSKFMSEEVYSLSEDDSLTRAVHMFALYGARRLPVLRETKLVGIVTRRDLLEFCIGLDQPLAAPLEELMPELPSVGKRTRVVGKSMELLDLA
jgi:CBS domain-containing protein